MIRTVAELLEAFKTKEVEILDRQNIKHAPTIGRMYEGLTQEILKKSLPEDLELRVVSGFIEGKDGELSSQIDCMLVIGDGSLIPYTDNFKYTFDQVIAVIEIKKNLFSNTLESAYSSLSSFSELSLNNLRAKATTKKQFQDAYYSLIGENPYSYKEFNNLPVWKKQVWYALFIDSFLPIRVVFGYHGFASENGLREAFIEFLFKRLGQEGFGPNNFPDLITSGRHSLIKLNFMPYGIRISDRRTIYKWFNLSNIDTSSSPIDGENMWALYASYPENPILLLLEIIWTRLGYSLSLQTSGYDLGMEILRPLLLAKAIKQDNEDGWHYEYVPFYNEELDKLPTLLNWKPFDLNHDQALLISYLINDENSGLNGLKINQPELLEIFDYDKERLDVAIQSIIIMGIVTTDKFILKLTTRHLKVASLPNGNFVAGEDNEGMFTRWLLSNYEFFIE